MSLARRPLLLVVAAVTGIVAVMALPAPSAGAIPPCPVEPLAGDDCPDPNPPPPPPPPAPPGPIGRQVMRYETDQTAVPATEAVLDTILDHVQAGARGRFLARNPKIVAHIVPHGQNLTDLPLWAPFSGVHPPGHPPGTTYDQLPGAASPGCTGDVGVQEAWITTTPGGPPPEKLGRVMAHEIGHEIQCAGLTPAQNTQLTALRNAARARYTDGDPLNDRIVGDNPGYTTFDKGEFFAEATAAWFDMGPPRSTYRRQWLHDNDRPLYDLLGQIYTAAPAPAYCNGERATLVIGTSGQTVTGNLGRDIVVGSSGRDIVDARHDADVVCGGGGSDTITGYSGNDIVFGGAGVDDLEGGPGDDLLVGGLGNDGLDGQGGSDNLLDSLPATPARPAEPGGGTDTMVGGSGDDDLFGEAETDILFDDTGRDVVDGGVGDDLLVTVDAEPTTVADTLNGGGGVDICGHDPVDQVFGDCSGTWPGG